MRGLTSSKYIRIQKVAVAYRPKLPTAESESYPHGGLCPTHSFPIYYWVEGWLLSPPRVGERVRVSRCMRNGVACSGHFFTSAVKVLRNEHEFSTANSVYHWYEIPPPKQKD